MAYVSLAELIQAARTGAALISFPTDTVPALASHPDQAQHIFEAKQRNTQKPLILMAGTADDLWPYVQGTADEQQAWNAITSQYWPGALTLVLPASDRIPTAMNPHNPTTLGIRVPDCAIARHILSQTGPLATTSVNRSGEPALLTADEINRVFPEVLTLSPDALDELGRSLSQTSPATSNSTAHLSIVNQGNSQYNATTPSTVIQWTGSGWNIVRQGRVAFDTSASNI
ncbi:MAG: L-threonylcarbamoyladenylate synthase [Cyanobacteria bacterium P01_E01_bin.6]